MHPAKLPKIFQPFSCPDLIRLGDENDGGYLVNKSDILKTEKLISLGVGDSITFEQDFYTLNNCPIIAFDDVIKTEVDFFSGNKSLIRKKVGSKNSQDYIDIKSLINTENIFLKCDIEGGEYEILDDIIELSPKLTGIVIEFHSVNEQKFFDHVLNFIGKIEQKLVHTHINNWYYFKTETMIVPDIFEFTFSSSDNIRYDSRLSLPHSLDMPNNPDDLDFSVTFNQ